eukprot:augustus_masked-scaffold_57-processed-gene-1.67-mRNA-1 protein AED:0.00 eAED:0.00 QI:0/-1/0/1/-1/1/1/0/528
MSYIFEKTDLIKTISKDVVYTDESILTSHTYNSTSVSVQQENNKKTVVASPKSMNLNLKTKLKVPKTGVMFVGWGGNNGATVTAGVLANKLNLTYKTKDGIQKPNYFGSLTQSSSIFLGLDQENNSIYVPFYSIVPLLNPNDLEISGWDISSDNLAQAMEKSKVLDINLQEKLKPYMKDLVPLKSIYNPEFIAANQSSRANHVIKSNKLQDQLDQLITDIESFKKEKNLDKVIILWTANTERFCELQEGINDTADNLLATIRESTVEDEVEISPSTLFAVASILTGSAYINGSPQNTFVPGVVELAQKHQVFIAGDDFKSGQTKMKSVLVDFLVSAGIKVRSIVSYNHLGNNDGKNLSAPKQFRSKEISKSNVVDDMIASNGLLYNHEENEHPDHCVVIKYVPFVGDSKRAMDEYTSEIFMGGRNTIVMHNTCEDSLLAAPLILDLVILTEFFQRIEYSIVEEDGKEGEVKKLNCVLSFLSFLLKAPLTPPGTPVVNALFPQRQAIVNFMRACVGLPPDNNILLEHRM